MIRHRWQRIFAFCTIALLIAAFSAQQAGALDFTNPFTGAVVQCDAGDGESVTVKIVSCIKAISYNYSKAFLQKMTEVMLQASVAIITIAVVLTAMKVMLGERNPGKIIYGLLFKVLFVLILAHNFGGNTDMSSVATGQQATQSAQLTAQANAQIAAAQAQIATATSQQQAAQASLPALTAARIAAQTNTNQVLTTQQQATVIASQAAQITTPTAAANTYTALNRLVQAQTAANSAAQALQNADPSTIATAQNLVNQRASELQIAQTNLQNARTAEINAAIANNAQPQDIQALQAARTAQLTAMTASANAQEIQRNAFTAENQARNTITNAQSTIRSAQRSIDNAQNTLLRAAQVAAAPALSSGFFQSPIVTNVWGEEGLLGALYGTMEGMQEWIINAMYVSTDTCDLNAHNGQTNAYTTATNYKPFAYMDCVLEYIMGFNTAAGIGASLLGFTSSALFGGTMGSMVFFFGLAVLLSVTFFVMRVLYTVIICYVYLGLLIGTAPIFVWTLLFKVTEQTFFTYMLNILATIMQPFMMVAFLGFAIPMLNTYILDETNERSLVNVLGQATPSGEDSITEHYRTETPFCNLSIPTDLQFYNIGLDREKVNENEGNPLETGSFNWCAGMQGATVDLGPDHNNKLLEIARSLFYIVIVAMIITSVGAQIPMLTAMIVTRGRYLAGAIAEGAPLEKQVQGSVASARSGGAGGINSLQSLFQQPAR
jgi:hypothetical protein